jgi:hypothetical protein
MQTPDGPYDRYTITEVYNGWIVKVTQVDRGTDKIVAQYVFESTEGLLSFLKDQLTTA